MYVLGGILVALFGLPLGFGGVAVADGAIAGTGRHCDGILRARRESSLCGLADRLGGADPPGLPGVYYQLVELGYIHMGPPGFIEQVPAAYYGLQLI